MKSKKILIVSFFTYPCRLVGAKRVSYLANYLAQKNFNVTIVKAKDDCYYGQIDNSLRIDPEIKVIEVNRLNKFSKYKQSIYRFIRFYFALNKVLKNETYDISFYSGGPFFYFPLGILFKFKYRISYILDFRDVWITCKLTKLNWKGKILQRFEKYFEKESVKMADLIVSVSPQIAEIYKNEFCLKDRNKIISILNGYTENELPNHNEFSSQKQDLIKIGIFGKFSYYNITHLEILLEAISKLKKKNNIQIFHIGLIEKKFIELVDKCNLRDNFHFNGFKNYTEGLSLLENMDYLILNNRLDYGLGTKIFDYLYLNKPILSFLTPQSENWFFLSQFSNVYLIQNSNDFILAIQKLVTSEDISVITKQDLKKYSREYQTKIVYDNINSILDNCWGI
jgi:glycosyltransferase involved in cell wall biosynthesis